MSGSGLGTGVAQALSVLEEVARSGPSVSANGIARALGMPKSSAYRLINSLVSEEYLLRHPELDGFLLGVRVVELAHLVAPRRPLRAADVIDALRSEIDEPVHLVRYQHGRVVIADEDPRLPLLSLDRTRRQLASTAIGRLLLAGYVPTSAPEAARERVHEVVMTARSAGIGPREHLGIAAEVAERDYAAYSEPDANGRACVAVPLRGDDGLLVGGLAVATPTGRLEIVTRHVERLRLAARDLMAEVHEAPLQLDRSWGTPGT